MSRGLAAHGGQTRHTPAPVVANLVDIVNTDEDPVPDRATVEGRAALPSISLVFNDFDPDEVSTPRHDPFGWMPARSRHYRVTKLLSHVTFAGYDQLFEASIAFSSIGPEQSRLVVKQ